VDRERDENFLRGAKTIRLGAIDAGDGSGRISPIGPTLGSSRNDCIFSHGKDAHPDKLAMKEINL
jgi:hypothetical protein